MQKIASRRKAAPSIIKTISKNYYSIEGMKDDTNTIETSFEYNEFDYPVKKNAKIEYIYK